MVCDRVRSLTQSLSSSSKRRFANRENDSANLVNNSWGCHENATVRATALDRVQSVLREQTVRRTTDEPFLLWVFVVYNCAAVGGFVFM